MNSSFCALLFKHVATRPNGQVMPCCKFDDSLLSPNARTSRYWNNDEFNQMRQNATNGVKIPGCHRCYADEAVSNNSMRLDWNLRFGNDTEVVLKYLELAISNVCNNKCIICNENLSSNWYEDSKHLRKYITDNRVIPISTELSGEIFGSNPLKGIISATDIDQFDTSNLEILKLIGGEPLMEERKILSILERSDLSKLNVHIISNLTLIPSDALHKLLSQCKSVEFYLSVDAYGTLNDFLRKGSKWDNTVSNISWYVSNYKKVFFHSVYSIFNINNFFKLSKFLQETYHIPLSSQVWTCVNRKDWMLPRNLPTLVKYKCKEQIINHAEYLEKSTMNKVLTELDTEGNYDMFKRSYDLLTTVRPDEWRIVNPELWGWIHE